MAPSPEQSFQVRQKTIGSTALPKKIPCELYIQSRESPIPSVIRTARGPDMHPKMKIMIRDVRITFARVKRRKIQIFSWRVNPRGKRVGEVERRTLA